MLILGAFYYSCPLLSCLTIVLQLKKIVWFCIILGIHKCKKNLQGSDHGILRGNTQEDYCVLLCDAMKRNHSLPWRKKHQFLQKRWRISASLWHHIPGDSTVEIFTAVYILKITIPEFSLNVWERSQGIRFSVSSNAAKIRTLSLCSTRSPLTCVPCCTLIPSSLWFIVFFFSLLGLYFDNFV